MARENTQDRLPPTAYHTEISAQKYHQKLGRVFHINFLHAWRMTRLLDMLVHGKGLCRYPLSDLLAPGGAFYLVAIKQNKPESIVNTLQGKGLQAEVGVVSTVACFAGITLTMFAHDQIVLSRRAGGEHLYIIRAIKPAHAPSSG